MAKLFSAILLHIQLTACTQVADNRMSVNPIAFYGIDTTTADLLKANLITFLDDVKDYPINSTVIDKDYIKNDPDAFVFFANIDNNVTQQPVVMRVDPINPTAYKVKLAYTKTDENSSTTINCIYNVYAQKHETGFKFYSMASYHSGIMQSHQAGSILYKYTDHINKADCKKMDAINYRIAAMFGLPVRPVTYYKFKNAVTLFNHLGFDYLPNMYYDTTGGFVKFEAGTVLAANNSEIYEHEFVHLYTRSINNGQINNFADEGLATLLGGSGGITYEEGISHLANRIKEKNITNIYEGYIKDFQVDGKISAKYFIGALICKKIKEKYGMNGITKVVTAPNSIEHFLSLTNTLIGLNASNFNETIAKWLQQEIVQ